MKFAAMVSIPSHLKSHAQIATYLDLRHDLAEELAAFRRAYPRSRRFVPPDHWRIWAERDDDDDVFHEGWALDDRVIHWLDAHCPGWGSMLDPEGGASTFWLGFALPEHMMEFKKRWARAVPPDLRGVLGFEVEQWLTLEQHDALMGYIGALQVEVENLRKEVAMPEQSIAVWISTEAYQTLALAAAERGEPIERYAAMELTIAASQVWRQMSIERGLADEDDTSKGPLPSRPIWPPEDAG